MKTLIAEARARAVLDPDLRQTQTLEAVGRLAAGITHELNTPIQYVGGNVQFLHNICRPLAALLDLCAPALEALRASPADPAFVARFEAAIAAADLDYLRREMPRALEDSLEGIDRVGKLLRAVREFAHPGHGEKIAADLNHAIQTTITVAHNEWRDVADVVTVLDRDLPLVMCWVDEFNQVVLNLLLNASQAIREHAGHGANAKGTITVGTRQVDGCVEIWVQDTGTGIPDTIRARVFEPFFTTKSVGNGTGQGLSLAHSVIVDRHGGDIRFDSQPGAGSTFFVRLPIER